MGRECLIINAYANKWVDYVIFESAWVTVSTGQSTGLKLQTIMNKEGTFFINKKKHHRLFTVGRMWWEDGFVIRLFCDVTGSR